MSPDSGNAQGRTFKHVDHLHDVLVSQSFVDHALALRVSYVRLLSLLVPLRGELV